MKNKEKVNYVKNEEETHMIKFEMGALKITRNLSAIATVAFVLSGTCAGILAMSPEYETGINAAISFGSAACSGLNWGLTQSSIKKITKTYKK